MHHTIAEILRLPPGGEIRPEVLGRLQQELMNEVQPLLNERDRLLEEREARAEADGLPVRRRKG